MESDRYKDSDRRESPRADNAVVVDYCIEGSPGMRSSFMKNISLIGICIVANDDIEVGTDLSLEIYLPGDDEPVLAKGRVIWAQESSFLRSRSKKHYDLGIEFFDLDDWYNERIIEHISSSDHLDTDSII